MLALTTNPPSITVLMSVYNGARWLNDSIESVLNQTFTDFEFIIVNDGSTDHSFHILEEYASKDSRIKLFDKKNTGLADSLNFGIERAQGKWIARVDADDINLLTRLEDQYHFASCNPACVLIGGGLIQVDIKGRKLKSFSYPQDHTRLVNNLEANTKFFAHSCAFINTDVIRKIGGYRTRLKRAEDLDLWLRLSQIGKIGAVDKAIIKLRIHPEQVSHEEGGRRQKLDAFMAITSYWLMRNKQKDPVSASELEYLQYQKWLESRLKSDGYFYSKQIITEIRISFRSKQIKDILIILSRFSLDPKTITNFIYFRFFTKRYTKKIVKSWLAAVGEF